MFDQISGYNGLAKVTCNINRHTNYVLLQIVTDLAIGSSFRGLPWPFDIHSTFWAVLLFSFSRTSILSGTMRNSDLYCIFLPTVLNQPFLLVLCVCVYENTWYGSISYGDTNQSDKFPIFITSLNLKYFFKGSISKYSYTGCLRLQTGQVGAQALRP